MVNIPPLADEIKGKVKEDSSTLVRLRHAAKDGEREIRSTLRFNKIPTFLCANIACFIRK